MKQALIKVCGMRQADNIREAEALGIDWMGLIFWPKTPRYVAQPPGYLPEKAKRVGVFVDADLTDITSHVVDYRLDFIQLHGKETPDYIDNLRLLLNGQNSVAPGIIKAFSIADADDLRKTEGYEGKADYYLFDTKGKAVGGSVWLLHKLWSSLLLTPRQRQCRCWISGFLHLLEGGKFPKLQPGLAPDPQGPPNRLVSVASPVSPLSPRS